MSCNSPYRRLSDGCSCGKHFVEAPPVDVAPAIMTPDPVEQKPEPTLLAPTFESVPAPTPIFETAQPQPQPVYDAPYIGMIDERTAAPTTLAPTFQAVKEIAQAAAAPTYSRSAPVGMVDAAPTPLPEEEQAFMMLQPGIFQAEQPAALRGFPMIKDGLNAKLRAARLQKTMQYAQPKNAPWRDGYICVGGFCGSGNPYPQYGRLVGSSDAILLNPYETGRTISWSHQAGAIRVESINLVSKRGLAWANSLKIGRDSILQVNGEDLADLSTPSGLTVATQKWSDRIVPGNLHFTAVLTNQTGSPLRLQGAIRVKYIG